MIKKITCKLDQEMVNREKLTSVLNELNKLGALSSFEIAYDDSDEESLAKIKEVMDSLITEQ